MYHFDPYNVLLAIATNIPVRLMTGFVVQGHFFFYIICGLSWSFWYDFSCPAGYLMVSSVVWWTTVRILWSVPVRICPSTQHMQRQQVWLHSMRPSMLLASFVSQVTHFSLHDCGGTNLTKKSCIACVIRITYSVYLSFTHRVCLGRCDSCAVL